MDCHFTRKSLWLSLFLLSIYLPVILYYPIRIRSKSTPSKTKQIENNKSFHVCDTFMHAVQIMVMIGLYVMIFSIVIEIATPYCQLSILKMILSSFEITNGLQLITTLSMSHRLKCAFICSTSAFGGLCSAFQIKSVLEYQDASIKKYLLDKIILSAGTFIIIFYLA